MKSLAEGLPAEIARQVHPDWRKNEAQYWAARNQLLARYKGRRIGFAAGVVIASGSRPVAVFEAAHQSARHPFVLCVGREEEPCRMRRATFAKAAGLRLKVSGSAGIVAQICNLLYRRFAIG